LVEGVGNWFASLDGLYSEDPFLVLHFGRF
jgi:hypothetical protein